MVLRLQVWLGEVLPSNTSVIASIRSLEPYTISWSNVPDFMPPADFHKLAKAVSAPNETVHYMHRCCGSDSAVIFVYLLLTSYRPDTHDL